MKHPTISGLRIIATLATAFVLHAATPASAQEPPMMTSGVVTYSDWMHVFRKDYKKAEWFWSDNGINYIVERSHNFGMKRLYWRALNGSCSLSPITTIRSGGSQPIISLQSQYQYDYPAYQSVYGKYAPDPFQVTFMALSPPASGALVAMNQDILPTDGSPFTIEFRLRAPSATSPHHLDWIYTNPKYGEVRIPLISPDHNGKSYNFYRIAVTPGEQAVLYIDHKESPQNFSFVKKSGSEPATGFLLSTDGTKLELDKLFLSEGLWAPQMRYPDEAWPLAADYGPTDGTWRDDWRNHWIASKQYISVTAHAGDPIRYEDYAIPPFSAPGFLPASVRATQSEKMEAYIWFSHMEENHYGKGPHSLFSRKNPKLKEVDTLQRTWDGRLSYAYPEVRQYKIQMIKAAVEESNPDGILLDFVRRGLMDPYHEVQTSTHIPVRDQGGVSIFGYDTESLSAFEKRYRWRPNANRNDNPQWIDFRNEHLTRFMQELREAIPNTKIAIMVFSGSAESARRGDLVDWKKWAEDGLCDEIVFLIDNGSDGRPFVRPFGAQPTPLSSVQTIIESRKRELPNGFPLAAAVFGYRITAPAVAEIYHYAHLSGASELMWWETSSLEWADYGGSVWQEIKKQINQLLSANK